MKLGTFNVHGWADAQGRKRVDDTLELLRTLACDVLVLNEVRSAEGPLERIADALGMHATFVPAGWGGNAILTREAPRDVACVTLDAARTETRSAVVVRVGLVSGPTSRTIDVVGLHLDQCSEDDRLTQLVQLLEALAPRAAEHADHVLVGDFNAMRLADMGPAELALVRRRRRKQGWEEAREDVVHELDRRGYVDAVRLSVAGSLARYRDTLAAPIAPAHAITSRVDTRIDHIYVSSALADRVHVASARTVKTDVSDHLPVVVELVGLD